MHVTVDILDLAVHENIIMYFLPAHTSHITQQLDQLFATLKEKLAIKADLAPLLKSDIIITKQKFTPILWAACDETYTPVTIKDVWRVCGAYPPSFDAIPQSKIIHDIQVSVTIAFLEIKRGEQNIPCFNCPSFKVIINNFTCLYSLEYFGL